MAEEKSFENKIKTYLNEQGCYFVKYFANRNTKSGIPDILASVNGAFLAIEVKSSTGTPKPLQIHNIKKINNSGGYAVVVAPKSFDELTELIQSLKYLKYYEARKKVYQINSEYAKYFYDDFF